LLVLGLPLPRPFAPALLSSAPSALVLPGPVLLLKFDRLGSAPPQATSVTRSDEQRPRAARDVSFGSRTMAALIATHVPPFR